MSRIQPRLSLQICVLAAAVLLASSGCQTAAPHHQPYGALPAAAMYADATPKELSKVVLPQYTIEPPDILMIDAVHIVPKPPYTLRTNDVLAIQVEGVSGQLRPGDQLAIDVTGAMSDAPITNVYTVGPSGLVNLGPPYGSVSVADMTVEQAQQAVYQHLKAILAEPQVSLSLAESGGTPVTGSYPVQMGGMVNLGLPHGTVSVGGLTAEQAQEVIAQRLAETLDQPKVLVTLAEPAGKQHVAGEHLVNPDGTVNLGTYGSVTVVGLTIEQAKIAIEHHLSQFLENPEIAVSVFAYNSKVYYVIMQGAGSGDGVYRFPITGNETVLDAVSQLNGLTEVSSKRIWIARPTPDSCQCQVLPVDWDAITAQAATGTNYQLLPGDRLFVAHDKLIALDTSIAKITAPWERIMGFSLLGAGTVTRFSGPVLEGGGNRQGNF